jgi:hypothetical protein
VKVIIDHIGDLHSGGILNLSTKDETPYVPTEVKDAVPKAAQTIHAKADLFESISLNTCIID